MTDAVKNDNGKLRYDLVPPRALRQVAGVMTHGAAKYGEHNYLDGEGLAASRLFAAAQRHMAQWQTGEDRDESGHAHLAHAAASLLMLIETLDQHPHQDDRYYQPPNIPF